MKKTFLPTLLLAAHFTCSSETVNTLFLLDKSHQFSMRSLAITSSRKVEICELNDVREKTNRLSFNYKPTEREPSPPNGWVDKLYEARQCLHKAMKLGVTKFPAIVINEKYVVYGRRDVSKVVVNYEKCGSSNC